MKVKFLFGLLCLASMALAQQNAMFTYNVQLTSMDSIDTQKWIRENPIRNKENEIAQKYANLISSALQQYVPVAEVAEQDLLDIMQWNINGIYKDDYGCLRHNGKSNSLFHSNIGNKSFRDFLFKMACDILCELVSYLPKDYKIHLLRAFNNALKMLNDIPNHRYEIKEDLSSEWKPLVIFKDGRADYSLGYGINGFLLRRIYMDNIPYNEIKEKTTTLINKLKAVDNARNANVLCCYIINNEMMYCIASESNYFMSATSRKKYIPYTDEIEKAYYPNIVKYRYNAGTGFYTIYNLQWSKSNNKAVVIDANANVVYKE